MTTPPDALSLAREALTETRRFLDEIEPLWWDDTPEHRAEVLGPIDEALAAIDLPSGGADAEEEKRAVFLEEIAAYITHDAEWETPEQLAGLLRGRFSDGIERRPALQGAAPESEGE